MISASSEPPALGPLLQSIKSPSDVKQLGDEELADLAAEIRHSLITSLSKTVPVSRLTVALLTCSIPTIREAYHGRA